MSTPINPIDVLKGKRANAAAEAENCVRHIEYYQKQYEVHKVEEAKYDEAIKKLSQL